MAFSTTTAKLCREAVLARLLTYLPLADLNVASEEVAIRDWPIDRQSGHHYPGITVHPLTEQNGADGLCDADDIAYGVGVTWIWRTGSEGAGPAYEVNLVDTFRDYVRWMLHNQKIAVDCVWKCTVEFGKFFDPRLDQRSYRASYLVVRCWSEENRIAA